MSSIHTSGSVTVALTTAGTTRRRSWMHSGVGIVCNTPSFHHSAPYIPSMTQVGNRGQLAAEATSSRDSTLLPVMTPTVAPASAILRSSCAADASRRASRG